MTGAPHGRCRVCTPLLLLVLLLGAPSLVRAQVSLVATAASDVVAAERPGEDPELSALERALAQAEPPAAPAPAPSHTPALPPAVPSGARDLAQCPPAHPLTVPEGLPDSWRKALTVVVAAAGLVVAASQAWANFEQAAAR